MNRFVYATVSLLVLAGIASPAAEADEYWHRHGYERERWHDGRWVHTWHAGRDGWWWVIDGAWYFYPAPVYPYPEPPVVVVAPPAPPPPQYYYYCANPPGYYPTLPQCYTGWQLVPAAPAAAAPPPVVAPAPMPAPAPAPQAAYEGGDKTAGGTVLGAVGGAVAGAQFGHGPGKLAATALGTLLGAFVGHEVGASLDRADQLAAQSAEQRAYASPLGQTISWSNPDSGHSGTIIPVRDGTDSNGNYCREFQQAVTIGGKTEQAVGTACRQADGSWKVIGQ